jgi:hypothetical protein
LLSPLTLEREGYEGCEETRLDPFSLIENIYVVTLVLSKEVPKESGAKEG